MMESGRFARRLSVLDDDPAFQITARCLIRQFGHTVEPAESGSAGLALLLQAPVGLSLTELQLLEPP